MLLARVGPFRRPRDVTRATLLVQDHAGPYDEFQSWQAWFSHHDLPMPVDVPTISFNFTYQAVEAAVRGQGVMLAQMKMMGIQTAVVQHDLLTARSVGAIRRRGYRLYAWTIDDPERALELRSYGIDYLTTNVPASMVAVLPARQDGGSVP